MRKITVIVFWILLICTLLSQTIQRLMKVEVVVDKKYGGYLYTSKPMPESGPWPEEMIQVVEHRDGPEEEYLVVTSEGNVSKVLVEAKRPFMEQQVKNQLELGEEYRVFRVKDVEQFQSMLPRIFSLPILLIVAVAMWVCWLLCLRKEQKIQLRLGAPWIRKLWLYRRSIACLGTILIVTLIFSTILKQIILPTSLMPPDYIFDWEFYQNEIRFFSVF